MFQGLRTAIYGVPDIKKAKEWYTQVLGFSPYFDQPYYVGFNVGGYELGLDPNANPGSATGSTVYWGVEDAEATHQRLLELGAIANGGVRDVGEGIQVASVIDPFGNQLSFIKNPNFSLK
ncbi:MAG: VOC family protein [Chloroflexi bacterium]|uniref:Glyoxalase superfamily protein n=1 Tax=Candidatus Chlorohelix allophototropha TaxID=3003348 RepID=A0A8T7M363_9CHLR|nr:VOC family protein [Chloroflexota bacterium]WJW67277.1 glyoxalase superfamily protein [Chloroflexota bacterium L227-S17]